MRRGDTVQLNSGGAKMTIFSFLKDLPEPLQTNYYGDGFEQNDIVCKWFVGTTLKKEVFKQSMLKQLQ